RRARRRRSPPCAPRTLARAPPAPPAGSLDYRRPRARARPRPSLPPSARGQADGEAAPRPGRGLHRDAAPVRLDDALHDREADARAADRAAVDLLLPPGHASEELEDATVVSGRDADAVVAHREADAAVLGPAQHRDLALLGGDVLDRVAEEVAHHVPKLARLTPHAGQRADLDPDPLGGDLGAERLQRPLDQRAQLDPGRRL